MKTKLKIQVGVESYKDNRRLVRLTPLDRTVEVDDLVATVLTSLVGIVDAGDSQRGDGEIDVPLDKMAADLEKLLPGNYEWLPGTESLFVRIKRVA